MIKIADKNFEASISEVGAQLISFKNTFTDTEYIWCGDNKIWGKSSPILFPFVCALENGYYTYEGKKYYSDRHGFFQKQTLSAQKLAPNCAVFTLKANEETLELYPFYFEFNVTFSLNGSVLSTIYEVKNLDEKAMYFAVGGHTAFMLEGGGGLAECSLKFNKGENYTCYRSNSDGIRVDKPLSIFEGNTLALSPSLFDADSFMVKPVPFNSVTLFRNSSPLLRFSFESFKAFALWAKKGTNRFICLEPWSDLPEAENAEKELSNKQNLTALAPQEVTTYTQKIEIL